MKLSGKITISIGASIVSIFIILMLLVSYTIKREIFQLQKQNLSTISKQFIEVVENDIRSLKKLLEFNAKDANLTDSVSFESFDVLEVNLKEYVKNFSYLENVYIINKEGIIKAAATPESKGKNAKELALYKEIVKVYDKDINGKTGSQNGDEFFNVESSNFNEVMQAKEIKVVDSSTIYKELGNQEAVYGMGVPLFDNFDQYVGVMIFEINLEKFSKRYIENKKIGETGYITIFNKNGTVIGHKELEKINTEDEIVAEALGKIGTEDSGFFDLDLSEKIYMNYDLTKINNWYVGTVITQKDMQSLSKKVNLIIFIVLCLSLTLIIAVIFMIIKKLIITRLIKFAEKFELGKEGDLTVKVEDDGDDEISDLAGYFNEFIKNTNEMVGQINITSEIVSNFSENLFSEIEAIVGKNISGDNVRNIVYLKQTMGQALDNINSQTASTQETASTIYEVSETIQALNRSTKETKKIAMEASNEAELGGEAVKNAVAGIKNVSEFVKDIEDKATKLGESSDQIGTILGTIKEIAEQTNLLALNAAIEAARAGDAGKGFAVVADEVKKLSGRTQEATEQIADLMKVIIAETSGVIKASKNGYQEALKDKKYSEDAERALQNIITKIFETSKQMDNLSNSMEEETYSIDEISKAVENIAYGSTNISKLSEDQMEGLNGIVEKLEQILGSAFDLSGNIDKLNELITKFNIK